jgi:RNA polymerase sigma-70 factor (ECF subfamily)
MSVADRFQENRVSTEKEEWRADEAAANARAFRAVYEAHVGDIYRYIFTRVSNREEAEDLTAQVFVKALHGTDWQRDAATIHHWLLQVARTTIADHWRAVYRLRTTSLDGLLEDGWEGPAAIGGTMEELAHAQIEVADIMAHLPPRYQAVLRYRFLLNYSLRETAQQMDMTESNVKIVQLRALRRAAHLSGQRDEQGRAHAHE